MYKIIIGVPAVLHTGRFELTKVVINCSELIKEIPVQHHAKEVHEFTHNFMGKALGLNWNISEDMFVFPMGNLSHRPVTHRSMLSSVASIFHPLGLVSPWVLPGKLLLQEATHLKLDWDQSVSADIQSKWAVWVSALCKLCRFSFPHCVKPLSLDRGYYEHHIFPDASEVAYGACAYLI